MCGCIYVEYCDRHWDAPIQIQIESAASFKVFGQQTTTNWQPLQNQPQVQTMALSVVTTFLETLHLVTERGEVRILRLGLFQAVRRQFWQALLPPEFSIDLVEALSNLLCSSIPAFTQLCLLLLAKYWFS